MTLQTNGLGEHLHMPDARVERSRNMEMSLAKVIWFGGLASLFAAILSSIGSGTIREFYFISDMLYLPTLFADLTQWSGRFLDWSLTPAPYLFPDLLIYAATRSVGLSIEWAHYSAGMIQMLGIVLGARAIMRSAAPENARQANFVAPAFAIVVGVMSGKIVAIASLFVISCHGGAALVALVVLALCMRQAGGRAVNIAIATLSCLAAFSDPLFVVSVAIPAAAFAGALMLLRTGNVASSGDRAALRNRYIITSGSAFVGSLITRFVNAQTSARYLQPRPQRIGETVREFVTDAFGPGRLEFGVLFITLLISCAVVAAGNRPSLSAARRIGGWTIASATSSIAAVVLTGRFHEGSFRYLIVPLVLGITTVAAWAGALLARRSFMMVAAAMVVLTLGIQTVAQRDSLFHGQYTSDLRERARCVAATVKREHSDTLLSDYWHAKPLMLMTGGTVKALQLDQHLKPRFWINSRGWYRGEHEIAVVVTNDLSQVELAKRFGSPTQTEHCKELELYVYRGRARIDLQRVFQSEVAKLR